MINKVVKFMKEQNVYDAFCSELKKQNNETFLQMFKKFEGKRRLRFRSLPFQIEWRSSFDSITEKEKVKSFEYWNIFL